MTKAKTSANRITFINIVCSLALNIISMITMPIFSRTLGTEGYGVVAIYTTWVTIFTSIIGLKVESSIPNAFLDYPKEKQVEYQSNIIRFTLAWLGIVIIITSISAKPLAEISELDIWMVPLIVLNAYGCFAVHFLNSKYTIEMKPLRNLIVSVGASLAIALLSVILVLTLPVQYRVYGKVWGNAIPYAILGAGIAIYYCTRKNVKFKIENIKYCLKISLPLVPSTIFSTVFEQSDRLMLQSMRTSSEVGIYSLAYNFSGIVDSILYALNHSWIPFYYRLEADDDPTELKKRMMNYTKVFSVLAMGFILLGKEVFVWYAGEEFRDGAQLVPILAMGIYARFIYTLAVNYEQFMKKTGYVAASTFLSALINVGLNYILIPFWGIMGATIATAMAKIILALVHWLIAIFAIREEHRFSLKISWFVPYIFGVLGATFLALFLDNGLWYIKWCLGALIGIMELRQLMKRRTIF
jgi:O-antigen/teichoic acid export membrane protein